MKKILAFVAIAISSALVMVLAVKNAVRLVKKADLIFDFLRAQAYNIYVIEYTKTFFVFVLACALLFFLIREFVRYFRGNSIKYEVRYSYEQFKAWKEEEIAKRNAKNEETRKRKMQERKEKLQKELQDLED